MKKLAFAFSVLALSIASAKTFTLTLFQQSVVAGTELKPGEYQVDLKDNTVVIKNGKQKIESAVKVENGEEKFGSTTVRYANAGGKLKVQEIRLGGTKTRLVFND